MITPRLCQIPEHESFQELLWLLGHIGILQEFRAFQEVSCATDALL